MPFQVSPGVNVSEIDLTTVVPAVSTTDGAIFISNVTSAPDGHREGGIDSKIYVSSIFKDYYERIDKEPGKLTSRMYDTLQPYMSLKPANPAPAEKPIEEKIQTQFTPPPKSATGASGATGAGGGAILISTEDAVKAGILVKLPSKYVSGKTEPYLTTNAAKRWLEMLAYMETQGFSPTAPVKGGKNISGRSIFRSPLKQATLWRDQEPPRGIINPAPTAGIDSYQTAAGVPRDVAPPLGTYWKGGSIGKGSSRKAGGSYHMWGRAVDMNGNEWDTLGDSGLPFATYWNKATTAQKWMITYGDKWGWYGYDAEVWHIYDSLSTADDKVKTLKLL